MNWNDIFEYSDGQLFWNENGKSRKMGVAVGAIRDNGYIQVGYNRKLYLAHRIVWEKHNGPIPEGMMVDHINHIRDDNRIENLRLVNCKDNTRNTSIRSDNNTGHHGVCWCNRRLKWYARINIDGKNKFLGYFITKAMAIEARKQAEKLYGFHENHGVKL